jgi:hypothetical protein
VIGTGVWQPFHLSSGASKTFDRIDLSQVFVANTVAGQNCNIDIIGVTE